MEPDSDILLIAFIDLAIRVFYLAVPKNSVIPLFQLSCVRIV